MTLKRMVNELKETLGTYDYFMRNENYNYNHDDFYKKLVEYNKLIDAMYNANFIIEEEWHALKHIIIKYYMSVWGG